MDVALVFIYSGETIKNVKIKVRCMFKDRFDAGEQLAKRLKEFAGKDTIVLAIPRGGLQVGAPIAKALHCPLDVIVAKKIPYPGQPELAIGAVGEDGSVVINESIHGDLDTYINEQKDSILASVKRKAARYHEKAPVLHGRVVILTDDGIATGSTMLTCVRIVRKQKPKMLIVALPIGPKEGIANLSREADKVVCLETPDLFFAVGQGYENFTQVEDAEAIAILRETNT